VNFIFVDIGVKNLDGMLPKLYGHEDIRDPLLTPLAWHFPTHCSLLHLSPPWCQTIFSH